MLDIKGIRENLEKVKDGLKKRGMDTKVVDDILVLDSELRRLKAERDELRHQKKVESRKFYQEHKNDILDDGWKN